MSETARLALVRTIARRIATGSLDEIRIVDRIWSRLEIGREVYGPLVLATDRRDWRRERFEERIDALIYGVIDELTLEDRARANLHEAARGELLSEWNPGQRTVASAIPQQIALSDIADKTGPYELQFDTSDIEVKS